MFNIFIGLNTLLFLTLITSIYYEIKHELKYLLNEKKDIFLYDYFFCKNIIFICLVITILTILAINYNIIKRNFLILTIGNVTLIIIYKYVFTINTILFTILEYIIYFIIIITLVIFDINKNKIKKIAVLVSWLFISLPISIILCYYQHKYINQFNTNDYFNLIPYKNKIILKTLIYIDIILKIGIYPNFKSIQSLRQNNNESIVLFINNMLDSIIILRVLFFYNFFINSNNDILILILLVIKFKFFLEIKKTNLKFNKKIIIFLNQKTIEILILLILSNFNKFNLLTLLIVLKTLYSILLIILLWLNKYRFFIFKSLTKINSNLLNVKYIKPSTSINIYLRILLIVINTFGWFINTAIVLHLILNQFDLFNFIILSIVIILNNLNINYLLFDIILTLSINSKSISSNLSNHETIIIFLIILIFIEVIL